ncbi:energy transducer TonB [Aquincola sp. S2]|uniref:Energy transducer TonB n=1 Tax=Pseudaquabacterium terrae TaxID=2732868 RepID=A0ABX2EVK1_9BURK|nr:energy transducer TonB [Aquabacterium terrae]NRF72476.1 energy transducer TonB [Aquabacterium terrae]
MVTQRPILARSLAFLLLLALSAQAVESQYSIKEEHPPLGSAIRRHAVFGSPIPINKRYEELTASEKALVNQVYENVQPGDEPPFPADGLKPIHEAMRKAQAKLLVEGDLILIVTVGPNGSPTAVKVIGSPSAEMTNFAATVLLLTRFKPAVCQGSPCQMQFPFAFNFRVR